VTRVVWLLAAVLAAGAVGASAEGRPTQPAQVCALLPSTTMTRWERLDRRYLAAAFTAAGVSHRIVNAVGSGRRQRAQARTCLAGGADVLLVVPVDEAVGRAVGRLAAAADATVVEYERLTPGGTASYYVSSDSVLAGRLMAEGVVSALAARRGGPRRPVVARLDGPASEPESALVAGGAGAVLARAARSRRLVEGPTLSVAGRSSGEALAVARRLLGGSKPRVDAVVATDDALAGAVVAALEERGRAPIPLAGRGATVQGLRNVVSGRQTGTVYASPKLQANAAARVVTALVAGRPVRTNGWTSDGARRVPSVLLRPIWITRVNYAALLAEGAYTRSEICGGAYARYCR
jgi:D-xylose transport system substrate-binding protein